jgi:hypothetical protein
MTDQTTGFCNSVIGTDFYEKKVRALKKILDNSNCHTLDRDNLQAQRDKCGIGERTEEWRFAVD